MNKSNLYKLTLSYKSTSLGFKVDFLCEQVYSMVFHETESHILLSMSDNPTYAISLKKEHLLKEIPPVHETCFFQQCSYSSLIESGGEGHLGCYIINDPEVCKLEDRLAKIETYLKDQLRNKIEKAFKQEDDYFDRDVVNEDEFYLAENTYRIVKSEF